MLDRRRAPRLRSLKSAQIVFHRHWPAIDCVVRNFSAGGACVEMAGSFNTPLAFDLTILTDERTRRCRQIWRHVNRIGVAFARRRAPRRLHSSSIDPFTS